MHITENAPLIPRSIPASGFTGRAATFTGVMGGCNIGFFQSLKSWERAGTGEAGAFREMRQPVRFIESRREFPPQSYRAFLEVDF